MAFVVTRVFRHFVDGVPQVEAFPDTAPAGVNDLDVRINHFTEVENFTLLGYDLAHETRGPLERVKAIENLTVSAPEIQAKIDAVKPLLINTERLADFILDIGLKWEHNVASFNNLLVPGDPLKVSDPVLQARIDSLDELTEALVREANARAMRHHPSMTEALVDASSSE